MAEVGQVIESNQRSIKVRLVRKEACAKCGACTAGLESKDMFIEASNEAHARVGDWVEVMLKEENFIKAVMIMYLIPLAGLLIGLGLGAFLGALFIPRIMDLLSLVIGLLGAGGCFWFIHLNEERFKTEKYKPKAIKIVSGEDLVC